MLGLTLLLLVHFDIGALGFMLLNEVCFRSGLKSLAQREVSVDNQAAVTLLVMLSWFKDHHFSWNLWEGV